MCRRFLGLGYFTSAEKSSPAVLSDCFGETWNCRGGREKATGRGCQAKAAGAIQGAALGTSGIPPDPGHPLRALSALPMACVTPQPPQERFGCLRVLEVAQAACTWAAEWHTPGSGHKHGCSVLVPPESKSALPSFAVLLNTRWCRFTQDLNVACSLWWVSVPQWLYIFSSAFCSPPTAHLTHDPFQQGEDFTQRMFGY